MTERCTEVPIIEREGDLYVILRGGNEMRVRFVKRVQPVSENTSPGCPLLVIKDVDAASGPCKVCGLGYVLGTFHSNVEP